MNKRTYWTRQQTLELLDIVRTTCIDFLDGTRNDGNGEFFRCIESELRKRNPTTTRDVQQIETKWRSLKQAYDKHKEEFEYGNPYAKPSEFQSEMEDLFLYAANRNTIAENMESIDTVEAVAFFEEGLVVEESQDLSVDEDAVVIEEIVYDSQDGIDFVDVEASASLTKPEPKRRKLTAENMNAVMAKYSTMQKEQDEQFIRKQMELVENEFEAFREKEKEHWAQLKLDLEDLKEKFLGRIRKIAHGEAFPDPPEEPIKQEPKRRRTAVGGENKQIEICRGVRVSNRKLKKNPQTNSTY